MLVSEDPLFFCGINCNISSFIFYFIYLSPFFFFLESKGLQFYVYKKPAVRNWFFFYCLFRLYFIYFHSDLYLLPYTKFRLVFSLFSTSLRYKLWLFIWDISCFWCRNLLLWTSLLDAFATYLRFRYVVFLFLFF